MHRGLLLRGIAAGGGLIVVLIAAARWAQREQVLTVGGTGGASNRAAVETGMFVKVAIQPALLCDYYEHGKEHTPPRDPTGVMQRREYGYRAPGDPIALTRAKLSGSGEDARLGRTLARWEMAWPSDRTRRVEDIQDLQNAAEHSTLDARSLFEVARGMEFLAGDEPAGALFRAALTRASREFAGAIPGDPRARPLLEELDQTNALWRLEDYRALELRFRLARGLTPSLSVESRRAGCLLADALFYQNRFEDAANTIVGVQAENNRVGDLGVLDRSDLQEMEYLQGYLLYCAGRIELAIPHLRRVQEENEHGPVAKRTLFAALLQVGRLDEAQRLYEQMSARPGMTPWGRAAMALKLDQARQREEWRESASTSIN